jgi:2-haloacid dehalogenase
MPDRVRHDEERSVTAGRVTAIIFDVGNVLYGWDPQSFLERQIADDSARLRFIEDVDLWNWHDTLDGGRPFDEAAAELSETFPAYAGLISAWGERFGETRYPPLRHHQFLRRFLAALPSEGRCFLSPLPRHRRLRRGEDAEA